MLFLWQASLIKAQVALIKDKSSVKITGTSSLHDWEENVEQFKVDFSFNVKENTIIGIEKVNFSCKANSVTSENSIMTSKTHDALQVDKYPEITFRLLSTDQFIFNNGKLSGNITGDINLGGVTKRITVAFIGTKSGNKVNVKGSKKLNMTDFNIKPPTAMLGTLKTGEEVTIGFDLQFQLSEALAAINN